LSAGREALPQFGRRVAMALQAKGAHVGEIALSSPLGYRHHVVCIPKTAPLAPLLLEFLPGGVVQLSLFLPEDLGIYAADRTDALVAPEHLFPQVARICPEFPLMHAGV